MEAIHPKECKLTPYGTKELSEGDVEILSKMYCQKVSGGFIESPSHPLNYPSLSDEDIPIFVPEGSVIELTFLDFNLEASINIEDSSGCYDWVEVVDGDGTMLMTKTCGRGSKVPPNVVSRTHKMIVKFHSDDNQEFPGFLAVWKKLPMPVSGEIASPNYPENYPDNISIPYNITVAAGKRIELAITDMDIEGPSLECHWDHLKVYTPHLEVSSKLTQIS
jgi:cubilin